MRPELPETVVVDSFFIEKKIFNGSGLLLVKLLELD